jgi:NYN domain
MNAALLVDWENIRIGLNSQDYHCHRTSKVASDLISHARMLAQDEKHSLTYIRAFLPPSTEVDQLLNAGLTPELTDNTPQAADMALSAKAMQLAFKEDYKLVIIVANDAGFVATARILETNQVDCYLWAVSPRAVRDTVREWRLTRYLEDQELLGLEKCPAVAGASSTLFVFGCMRLAHDGRALWGYAQAIAELEALEFLGSPQDVRQSWDLVKRDGFLSENDRAIGVDGQPRPLRRLAFEQRDVWRPLVIIDSALRELGRGRGARSREEVLAALQHPLLKDPTEAMTLFDQLCRSGFVVGHDLYSLPADDWRFGTISALRRVTLIAIAAACEEEQQAAGRNGGTTVEIRELSKNKLSERWPRHVKSQRRVGGRERHLLKQQGGKFVRFAETAGILVRHYGEPGADGRPRVTYEVREHHPIAQRMATAVVTAIDTLRTVGAGSGSVHQDQVFEAFRTAGAGGAYPLGWTEGERQELLGMLAAAEIVRWSQNLVELTPLAAPVRDRFDGFRARP